MSNVLLLLAAVAHLHRGSVAAPQRPPQRRGRLPSSRGRMTARRRQNLRQPVAPRSSPPDAAPFLPPTVNWDEFWTMWAFTASLYAMRTLLTCSAM